MLPKTTGFAGENLLIEDYFPDELKKHVVKMHTIILNIIFAAFQLIFRIR